MHLGRIFRHLALPDWWVRRRVPHATLRVIENAIVASERAHRGELRFVFDATLPLADLWRDRPAREYAIDVFSELRVWDTEYNTGILVYVQLLDHCVEIIADRGIAARVGGDFWQGLCRRMEATFRRGDFEAGALAAIEEITAILSAYYPAETAGNPNELPDRPALR